MSQTLNAIKSLELAQAEEWMKNNPDAVKELGANSLYNNINSEMSPEEEPSVPEYKARPSGNKYLDALKYAEDIYEAFDSYPCSRLKGMAHGIRKAIDASKAFEVDKWYVQQWVLFTELYKLNIPLKDMLELKEGVVFDKEAPMTGALNDKIGRYKTPAEEQAEWERDKLVPSLHKFEKDVHPGFLRDCKDLMEQIGFTPPSMSCVLPQITFALLVDNMELIKASAIDEEMRIGDDEDGDNPTGLGYSKVDIETSKRFWAYRRIDSREGGLNMFFKVFGLPKKYTDKYTEEDDKGLKFLVERLNSSIEYAKGLTNPYA